ncbi:hypothetical protein BKA66DRAFT_551606 [Pyrenochaeta sp. MPI-SDFR-AT-0127]|nr:hypothetical protein BKA66DRAFT_551606 [Pyrenochaeta sp. MPI-SDFR-AT-0127]
MSAEKLILEQLLWSKGQVKYRIITIDGNRISRERTRNTPNHDAYTTTHSRSVFNSGMVEQRSPRYLASIRRFHDTLERSNPLKRSLENEDERGQMISMISRAVKRNITPRWATSWGLAMNSITKLDSGRLLNRMDGDLTVSHHLEQTDKPHLLSNQMHMDTPPPGFLTIPGELRNEVYEYVFAIPSGRIICRNIGPWGRKLCISLSHGEITSYVELNSFQYVNKQIRRETRGYPLKTNLVAFCTEEASEPSPLTEAVVFLQSLAPTWWHHVRRIVITHNKSSAGLINQSEHTARNIDFRALDELFKICRRTPHLTVHWACPTWKLNRSLCRFIIIAISLVKAFRAGTMQSCSSIRNGHIVDQWVNFWLRGRSAEWLDVPNFRIHPWNMVHDAVIYESTLKDAMVCCAYHTIAGAGLQQWRDQAIKWYADGI